MRICPRLSASQLVFLAGPTNAPTHQPSFEVEPEALTNGLSFGFVSIGFACFVARGGVLGAAITGLFHPNRHLSRVHVRLHVPGCTRGLTRGMQHSSFRRNERHKRMAAWRAQMDVGKRVASPWLPGAFQLAFYGTCATFGSVVVSIT